MFTLNIIDISATGIGIKFSVSKADSFIKDDHVFIKKIGSRQFDDPIECRIVHLMEIDEGTKLTNLDYKMGLEFVNGPSEKIKELVSV